MNHIMRIRGELRLGDVESALVVGESLVQTECAGAAPRPRAMGFSRRLAAVIEARACLVVGVTLGLALIFSFVGVAARLPTLAASLHPCTDHVRWAVIPVAYADVRVFPRGGGREALWYMRVGGWMGRWGGRA